MIVKLKNTSHHPLPKYETSLSAGMDLRAFLPEGPITLKPLQRSLVKTGLFMELPAGYEAQIRPRSGLALKHAVTLLNTPGTIDAGYRGEVCVILFNAGENVFPVHRGDRIAQMVIAALPDVVLTPVVELNETDRNAGGFGSTGIH
jgi:dUTP pyrophosphatase